jgi:hypothetical protein
MEQTFEAVQAVMRGPYKENNFCTVAAIACAFNWSAGKAHRHMAKHGRPRRGGPSWYGFREAVEAAGRKAEREVTFTRAFDGMTISRFRKEHPRGTYIIGVNGHALCLKDGEFMDWTAQTAGRRKIAHSAPYGVAIIK